MRVNSKKDVYLNSVIDIVTKAEDDKTETIKIVGYANCTSKDRAGDIIVESAWNGEAMTNYLKNPIILAFHDHSQPIGVMTEYTVNAKGLQIEAEISKSAGNVYDLIKDGVLKAFSVGFRVKDADYDSVTDIFLIKEVELHEVSVVSVPCNQDSTFSLAKSFDSAEDCTEFKKQFEELAAPSPVADTDTTDGLVDKSNDIDSDQQTDKIIKENPIMDPKELQVLIAAGIAESKAEEKRIADIAEAKTAEDQRIAQLAKSGAEALLETMEASHKADKDAFTGKMEEFAAELAEKSAEIVALQKNKHSFAPESHKAVAISDQEAEDAVLLSKLLTKGLFDTKMGASIREKAVNTSSSGEVSSDAYETVFSTNLERDIQDMLVMAPLFREIILTTANLTLPIRPDATTATWVAAAEIGGARTAATTGDEIAVALTEITLTTKKLAGKTFITDETEEDVLIPMLPLLRESLVEAHAKTWDQTLISSTGAGNSPVGLISRATTAAGLYVVEHTKIANGANAKIAAADLIALRRGLGQHGLDLNDLVMVVNLDAYWDLLEDPEFTNLNEVGALATKLTGQVGNMYGLPVLVSTQMPAVANGSTFAILANKKNFMVPRQRGMVVQSEYRVEEQQRILVATQRVGFNETIVGKGVAIMTYDADGA